MFGVTRCGSCVMAGEMAGVGFFGLALETRSPLGISSADTYVHFENAMQAYKVSEIIKLLHTSAWIFAEKISSFEPAVSKPTFQVAYVSPYYRSKIDEKLAPKWNLQRYKMSPCG